MKIKGAAVLLFFLSVSVSFSQGVATTAVPFLLIAPNSRASAMGEGGVALGDDVWAIYWNPAGYAFQSGYEASVTRADWLPAFGLSDLWILHGAFKMSVDELGGTVGSSLTYLNLGTFVHTLNTPEKLGEFTGYEMAFAVGYGTKLSDNLGIGVNARVIYSRLSPFVTAEEQGTGTSTGFGFDVGMLYKPKEAFIPFTDLDMGGRLSLGFNLSNMGPKMTYVDRAQADPLPTNLRFGFSYKVIEEDYNELTINTDINRLIVKRDTSGHSDEFYQAMYTTWTGGGFNEQLRQFNTSIGMEYWYGLPKLIAIRAGFFYEDPRSGNRKFMTFGAGIRWDMVGLDFSYIYAMEDQHPLGETMRLTLGFIWGN